MCNKAPKRTPELQGNDSKAPLTSTTRGGASPRRLVGARLRHTSRGVRATIKCVGPVTPPGAHATRAAAQCGQNEEM
eukprot:354448-Chlamydomonas_euryale.AAC.2